MRKPAPVYRINTSESMIAPRIEWFGGYVVVPQHVAWDIDRRTSRGEWRIANSRRIEWYGGAVEIPAEVALAIINDMR